MTTTTIAKRRSHTFGRLAFTFGRLAVRLAGLRRRRRSLELAEAAAAVGLGAAFSSVVVGLGLLIEEGLTAVDPLFSSSLLGVVVDADGFRQVAAAAEPVDGRDREERDDQGEGDGCDGVELHVACWWNCSGAAGFECDRRR